MNGLVVATECPTCGAPLDFPEGTNAIRCAHCGSNLLVTGRKRVLSYWVRPRVGVARAVERVRAAAPRALGQVGTPRLAFVPFYRVAGHEFRWERVPRPVPKEPIEPGFWSPGRSAKWVTALHDGDDLVTTISWAADRVRELISARPGPESPRPDRPDPSPRTVADRAVSRRRDPDLRDPVFRDRYVDRTLLASDLPDFGVESLGVRASVLRVDLFRRDALAALGRVVPVDVSAETALAVGMRPMDAGDVLHRTVIGRVLSLIYFPFWTVPIGQDADRRLAIVDAVADSVVKLDAPAALEAGLDRGEERTREVVGFRPLVCPNCGGDLPVRPDDVIFACGGCQRAWQVHGADFSGVVAEVAEVARPPRVAERLKYLPFWVLAAGAGADARRFFAPAFRFRRLKFLADLARKLSGADPAWTPSTLPPPDLHGCHYDAEDAVLLARFTAIGLGREPEPSFTRASLAWFPFRNEHHTWRDPFTGLALPEDLLV